MDFLLSYWRPLIFLGLGFCLGLYYERQNYNHGNLLLHLILGVLLAISIFLVIKLIHGEISLSLIFEEDALQNRATRRMIHFGITLIGYGFATITRLIYIFLRDRTIWI